MCQLQNSGFQFEPCHYRFFRRFSDIFFAAANAQMTFKSASSFPSALCDPPEPKIRSFLPDERCQHAFLDTDV